MRFCKPLHLPSLDFPLIQLVYSSSCAVYGNQDKLPITEDNVPNPNCPYGESKLFSEKVRRPSSNSSNNSNSSSWPAAGWQQGVE